MSFTAADETWLLVDAERRREVEHMRAAARAFDPAWLDRPTCDACGREAAAFIARDGDAPTLCVECHRKEGSER